jgi:hypothetical protein
LKTIVPKYTTVLIGLILIFSLFPQSADASIVWQDNFNSGNLDNWTVTSGGWTVTDGKLDTYYIEGDLWQIWHASSQVTGTWSFDLYHPSDNSIFYSTVLFLVNGTDSPDMYFGYGIRFVGLAIHIMKQDGGTGSAASLGFTIIEDLEDTWTHIDVTRNSTGTFNVFIDATSNIAEPNLSVNDMEYTYSERFVIDANVPEFGFQMDNITVDNEILLTPPDPTTPTETETPTTPTETDNGTPFTIDPMVLALGGGAIAVLVIVIVIIRKR